MGDYEGSIDFGDSGTGSPFLSQGESIDISQRNLPHWQFDGGLYFVTWRLADSLPRGLLQEWMEEKRKWLGKHPKPWSDEERKSYRNLFPKRMDAWLDAGFGACVLREEACATIVSNALRYYDGKQYDVASFVIMPNHVHVLFQLRGDTKIRKVLQGWKGVSARNINRYLERRGSLWQEESRDTSLRSPDHLVRCYAYIRENPAKGGVPEGEFLYYEAPGFGAKMRAWTGDFDA